MTVLRYCALASVLILFSFSFAYADPIDDLLRAIGKPLDTGETVLDVSAEESSQEAQATTTEEANLAQESERNKQIEDLRTLVHTLSMQLQSIIDRKAAEAAAAEKAQKDVEAKVAAEEAAKPENCAQITRTLARGMKGDDVRCLQLVLAGDGLLESANATGLFGTLTEKALKEFQVGHNLDPKGTGAAGQKTRAEVNNMLSLLIQFSKASSTASSTPSLPNAPAISFGPLLPNGVEQDDFVILAGEKYDYALKISNSTGGGFDYAIDWADGSKESGKAKNEAVKTVSHTYASGVYSVQVGARNGFGENSASFTVSVDPAGGGGTLMQIASPLNAFNFDSVTLMPVTIHALDARVSGSARLYLQDSADARAGSGIFLGEMAVSSSEDTTVKFPLTEIAPGNYWLQAIATRFQDCSRDPCEEYLPNDKVGPIKITDQTNLRALLQTQQEATSTATSTADTEHSQ